MPQDTKNKTPPQRKIKKINPYYNNRVFGSNYRPMQLTYTILDGLYQRTILKKIVQKYIGGICPSFYTLTVEDETGKRIPEIEQACKPLSKILNRSLFKEELKSYFVYGTAFTYCGNRDADGNPEELFLLHPRDVEVKLVTEPGPEYGDIEYYNYTYGGYTFKIPPEDIKVFSNDPNIGELYGNSIVNHLQDTLHQFLNNRVDLAEILDRYAIPLVQWAVDVEGEMGINKDDIIDKARRVLDEQLTAGDDIVCDARIEPRTLSFANDVGHLISILEQSRRDLGMLSIPESLLGGQISNLSGGKTQAAVFQQEINDYRANLNDFLAESFYIPFLETQGYTRGEDYHNIYIAFPPTTTELPSESIIWIKSAIELGLITLDEARSVLGFRGCAPGVTHTLKEVYAVRSAQYENANTEQKQKTDPLTPKNRDGRDPDNKRGNQ